MPGDLNNEKKKSFTMSNTSAAKKKKTEEEEVKTFGQKWDEWVVDTKAGCALWWENCKEYSHNTSTFEDGTIEHIYCNNTANNWGTYLER
jgi:hypothetical protein